MPQMPISGKTALMSAMAATTALLVGPAWAADGMCGAFVLTGGNKQIDYIDQPPAGRSIGDVRAGTRVLEDDEGQRVGELHFVSTLTSRGPEGDMLSGKFFFELPGGWITADTLYAWADATDTGQNAADLTLVVGGGVGPYVGASGTIVSEPGEPPHYHFDLKCHG
jgi:hypothetical protein